jgi:putative restriction endonuclease
LSWEVEAAHIVPHHSMGRDDIWNGIALCHLHHWAFDVGWFALRDDLIIEVSPQMTLLPQNYGIIGDCECIRALSRRTTRICLPDRREIRPHQNAVRWHRQNVFHGKNLGV